MIVVENSTIDHPTGSGSDGTLRADTDDNDDGLRKLSSTIKQEDCVACLQINHAGRFAGVHEPVAPSAVETFGKVPKAMTKTEIRSVVNQFADAALRVKNTGGRIATGSLAESILEKKKADLIGLARVLWADPEWPEKMKEGKENDIVHCDPDCGDTCMKLVMKKKPAFCVQWNHDKMKTWKGRIV